MRKDLTRQFPTHKAAFDTLGPQPLIDLQKRLDRRNQNIDGIHNAMLHIFSILNLINTNEEENMVKMIEICGQTNIFRYFVSGSHAQSIDSLETGLPLLLAHRNKKKLPGNLSLQTLQNIKQTFIIMSMLFGNTHGLLNRKPRKDIRNTYILRFESYTDDQLAYICNGKDEGTYTSYGSSSEKIHIQKRIAGYRVYKTHSKNTPQTVTDLYALENLCYFAKDVADDRCYTQFAVAIKKQIDSLICPDMRTYHKETNSYPPTTLINIVNYLLSLPETICLDIVSRLGQKIKNHAKKSHFIQDKAFPTDNHPAWQALISKLPE